MKILLPDTSRLSQNISKYLKISWNRSNSTPSQSTSQWRTWPLAAHVPDWVRDVLPIAWLLLQDSSNTISICLNLPRSALHYPWRNLRVFPHCFHLGMFGRCPCWTTHLSSSPLQTAKPNANSTLHMGPALPWPVSGACVARKKRTSRILWMTVLSCPRRSKEYLLRIHFIFLVLPCEVHFFLLLLDVRLLDCTSMCEMWKPNLDVV